MLLCANIELDHLQQLFRPYGLAVEHINHDQAIPGSFWQAPEAGLVADKLFVRNDTPVHSALHEACHFICMDPGRRQQLDTDAGGDYEEENAVCYLQILLAEKLTVMGRERMLRDMDAWGYTFRLGSSQAWFLADADDARAWLYEHGIIDINNSPTGKLRIR